MVTRTLVLSGGGPVGIAWESGIAAGLCDGGVDLREADSFLGTSAGSVVGAQLALGREPQAMAAPHLASRELPEGARAASGQAAPDLAPLMELMLRAQSDDRPQAERFAEVGAYALKAQTNSEEQFILGFGNRLANTGEWPTKRYTCTAIDAVSGEFVTWTNGSGVPLSAPSLPVAHVRHLPLHHHQRPPLLRCGIQSATNANLATGYDTVLIIALTSLDAQSPDPRAELARKRLQGEVDALRSAGAKTVDFSRQTRAPRSLRPEHDGRARNQPAAENGVRQGKAEAARIKKVWDLASRSKARTETGCLCAGQPLAEHDPMPVDCLRVADPYLVIDLGDTRAYGLGFDCHGLPPQESAARCRNYARAKRKYERAAGRKATPMSAVGGFRRSSRPRVRRGQSAQRGHSDGGGPAPSRGSRPDPPHGR